MIQEILRKWFGLPEIHCESCEILRAQLESSERERRELLERLLNPPTEVRVETIDEPQPIKPQYIPWRVKQQMLEQEDRKKAQLMRDKAKEIAELEKELGVNHNVSSPSGGVIYADKE